MSWKCPVCENVNQDAVPICTVCENIAPVITYFLSLEKISHAKEYEELLSEIYDSERDGDYEQMLSSALKATSVFNKNDTAVKKIHQAIKLKYDKQIQDKIIVKLKTLIDQKKYLEAQGIIQLWMFCEFDLSVISNYSEIIENELSKIAKHKEIYEKVVNFIIEGKPTDALSIIDIWNSENPDSSEFTDLRYKINNIIKGSETTGKVRKIPKPPKPPNRITHQNRVAPLPAEGCSLNSTVTKRKFPKVKHK